MSRWLIRLLSLFLLAFLFGASSLAQEEASLMANSSPERWAIPLKHPIEPGLGDWRIVYGWNPPFSEADVLAGKKRLPEILAEISQASNTLMAGEFVTGSETTTGRLWFAPRSGFVMVLLSTCAHSVERVTYGRCVVTSDGITLYPEGGTPFKRWGIRSGRFVRITQKNREVLVPKEDVRSFCRGVAGRGLGSGNLYGGLEFGRYADNWEVSDYETPPHLPPGYRKYAVEPVRAEVISVRKPFLRSGTNGKRQLVVQMTINVGANIKLLPRNELHVCLPDVPWYVETVEVVKVSARTALVECSRPVSDSNGEDGSPRLSVIERLEKLEREHPFRPGVKMSSLRSEVPKSLKPEQTEGASK